MIATMDINKAIDENGDVITPPLEFTTGFVRFAFVFCFECSFINGFLQVIRNRSSVVLGRDRNKL